MALIPEGLVDPVATACGLILRGPLPPEDRAEVPEDASPRRERGDETVDLTGGRAHFVDDADLERIAEAWIEAEDDPSHVTSLDFSVNKISDQGVNILVAALKRRPCRLANLDLDGNDLGDHSVEVISNALLHNTPTEIRRLDLSSNRITDDGVQSLVAAVQNGANTSLETLLLRANAITDVGLRHLCAWLEEPDCRLRSLHVSGNAFSELVLDDLAAALKKNTSLTELNLCNTMAQVTSLEALAEAIQAHPALLNVPLAFDGKKRQDATISDALARNRLEVKLRSDYVLQLKRSHQREVGALKDRIAELEAQLKAASSKPASAPPETPAEETPSNDAQQVD